MKQKKADVMGLRKSPRGVKPHPQTPHQPPLPSAYVPNPTPYPPSKLLRSSHLWSQHEYDHFEEKRRVEADEFNFPQKDLSF